VSYDPIPYDFASVLLKAGIAIIAFLLIAVAVLWFVFRYRER
jgi:hypothetical protein